VAATPAAVLCEQLAATRRRGESFADAWPGALVEALAVVPTKSERAVWPDVLGGMMQTWRDAFERVPASRHERALATVAQDPDRVPLPDRECERSGEEIPPDRGPLAIYCGEECKHETNRENERAARAA